MGAAGSGGGVGGGGSPRIANAFVVPAKAGTHSHRRLVEAQSVYPLSRRKGRGVWVLACAGTTSALVEAPAHNGAPHACKPKIHPRRKAGSRLHSNRAQSAAAGLTFGLQTVCSRNLWEV